ncbi:Glioma tumor suppressor candidate region protein 2 [Kappamyces sp. JEL0680]|nr:Glioma tumor suppressor candidate region protein 2 [Kappamyces sp. JEL0680]
MQRAIKSKTLVVEQIIDAHATNSAIPAILSRKSLKASFKAVDNPIGKKRHISRNIANTIEKEAAKKKARGLLPGSAALAKQKKITEKASAVKRAKGGFDMWAETAVDEEAIANDYLAPFLKKEVAKPVVEDTRPKAVPAVALPLPGISYQPTEKDHQAAIEVAASVEFKKLRKEEAIENQLAYPPELDLLDDDDFMGDSDGSEASENADAPEEVAKEKPRGKKTRAEINKANRAKQMHRKMLEQDQQQALLDQINKIKELEQDINNKEETQRQKKLLRDQYLSYLADTKTKRLGRHVFQPASMEIQLTDELADSLRTLKPEGSLVKDRFLSLQARNIIEPRVPVRPRRRYATKLVESHDYKRFR